MELATKMHGIVMMAAIDRQQEMGGGAGAPDRHRQLVVDGSTVIPPDGRRQTAISKRL